MNMVMKDSVVKKSKIPYIFVAFFAVVFSVNAAFVTFSITSWTGLETENPYVKGLNYNASLAAAAKQQARGWTSNMTWQQLDGLKVKINFITKYKNGNNLSGADFRVLFLRPTTAGFDSEVTLVETEGGHYQAVVSLPMPGIWDVKQVIEHKDGTYQSMQRISLKK